MKDLLTYFSKLNSWNDFKTVLESKTKLEKGNAFEELTKFYLEYDSKYKSELKKVWLFKELPPSISRKLNLPSNDQGIDLVAETFEGKYWAIQCKYLQDEEQKLSHRKISTFISLSTGIADNISFCLVCTTVDDYANLYKGKKNIGFCTSDVWNNLNKDFFDFVRAKIKGKEKKLEAYKPKPHQVKALREAKEYFIKEKNQRGKLVFPCGAGKSLTGYWITKELKAKHIIVAVPSLSLVKQTLEVYLRETVANNDKVKWLCICSDEGIGKNDDVAIHTQDIGVPCVTDKITIENWLKENKNNKTIIFTTYQSGKVIAEACKTTKFSFDLGIMDEAHKTVGDKDKLFSHLLFDKNIKIERRIFMTATERRYSGSSDTILSMDNVDVYGDTFTQMSFKEAIETDILSDYKIITLFISDNEVQKIIEQNAFVKPTGKEWDKETEARTLASLVAIRKAMTDYPIHHAVTFHSSIAKAKAFDDSQELFSKAYPQFKKIESFHVSGAMPTGERGKIVNEFATVENAIITNAKCLTEGVDVPNIDCVLFADSRKSTVDIVQAVGRALRKKQGKDFGYVILPVFTESKTKEEIIESDEFKEILTTIRALASNDERIIEFFRDRSKGNKKGSNKGLIQFNIDENITEFINENDLIEKLELTTWSKLAKLSWMPFNEAREFVRRLKLNSRGEFREFCLTQNKPFDLPVAVEEIYKDEWISMGDFLGTNYIANHKRKYKTFKEAREYARKLNFKSWADWENHIKQGLLRNDIPNQPQTVYLNMGWLSYGDFLGTGNVANKNKTFRSFEEIKSFAKKNKIQTGKEWKLFSKTPTFPKDIPKAPHLFFKDKGWKSWGDFLGTGNEALYNIKYKTYNDCSRFAIQNGIKTVSEWRALTQKDNFPKDIPKTPYIVYKDNGWKDWGIFLGTGKIADNFKKYKSFSEVKAIAQSLNLKSRSEWEHYCNSGEKLDDIPKSVARTYSNEWKGWANFLGTDNYKNIEYLNFENARKLVRELNLKSNTEWRVYSKTKRPINIPGNPEKKYKTEWKGWVDFLGKE